MKLFKVENMESVKGNKVFNQFVIYKWGVKYFQSYNSIIALYKNGKLYMDKTYYNYSRTTIKYRNMFTGLTSGQTMQKIKDGEIKLKNLND